ncbi:MAG: zonular occludens toxin domain-containing protein [Sulfolobaceae archaeon]
MSLAIISRHYKLNGYKIYTNIKSLKDKDFYLSEIKENFYNDDSSPKLLAIDEIYLWIDSRMSTSKRNKIYGYILMQSRKNGFDVVYTTNYYKAVDVRIRNLTDYIIEPEYTKIGDNEGLLKWTIYDKDLNLLATAKLSIDNRVFKLFDTKEKIAIPNL